MRYKQAQFGIPVPANRGARVDMFAEVMADIGDLQSVDGDLSTFSGHLVMCREMLATIAQYRESRRHFLVMLDEIGTGTDPNQVSRSRSIALTCCMNVAGIRVRRWPKRFSRTSSTQEVRE